MLTVSPNVGKCKAEIIEQLNRLSGSRSSYEVFCDWVECSAITIQNSCRLSRDKLRTAREEQYLRTIRPYGENAGLFEGMLGLMTMGLADGPHDILGEVYVKVRLWDRKTVPLFTPFHINYMRAKMAVMDEDGNREITLNEPSCEAGGMVIATARALMDKGVNYQRCLEVVAQDLDWIAVYMCYIQLSLLGISATVVQGDTLSNPYIPGQTAPECVFYTPRNMGVIL